MVQIVDIIENSVIQVCKIVEGQRYSKRLNERQITALLKVTCQRPQERERDIMQVCCHKGILCTYICIFFVDMMMQGSILLVKLACVCVFSFLFFSSPTDLVYPLICPIS